MANTYDIPLSDLLAKINLYSPRSVCLLNSMVEKCGVQKAFYAAFILICLQAQTQLPALPQLKAVTVANLKDYAFFEVSSDDQPALDLFDTLLDVFTHDYSAAEANGSV